MGGHEEKKSLVIYSPWKLWSFSFKLMEAIQTLIIATKIIDSMNIIATIQTSNRQSSNQNQ
jgi:hypothetical protein